MRQKIGYNQSNPFIGMSGDKNVTIETKQPTEKQKRNPDIEVRTRQSVEECASRLEALADSDPLIGADVALLPQDGKWHLQIAREYGHSPYSIMYFKARFRGYLQRTEDGGALLLGEVMPDLATYVTRGLYLIFLGPPLIFVALRVGFRLPLIWLVVVGLIGLMLYMLAWHTETENAERSRSMRDELENLLR